MRSPCPSWRNALEFLLASHAHLQHSRFVQVATIRPDGRPANRTMTFRFFLENHDLLFTTDARTEKVTQLAHDPWAELCWYFTDAQTQVRLLGTMRTVKSNAHEMQLARARTWSERSDESRQSFTWPKANEPVSSLSAFQTPTPRQPPENFMLMRFNPVRVETLDLACQPHTRELHTFGEDEWTSTRINP